MGLSLVGYGAGAALSSEPIDEPIDLKAAKKQCEIGDTETAHNLFLMTLAIPAARERAEDATWRQMLTATWDLALCGFPSCGWVELPRPPLLSVVSVSYVDTNGVTQVWASSNYTVRAPTGPRAARGRIKLAYGATWPSPRDQADAVTIRFTAGYGADGDAVPARLKMAMLRDVAALFENRENVTLEASGTRGSAIVLPDGSAEVYRAYKSRPTQEYAGGIV